MKNINGIWIYGLAGSGKSYASKMLSNYYKNSFIIDGDDVRNLISFDLSFSLNDRKIQIQRLFGMAIICIKNNNFPIISSVYMNQKIKKKCSEKKIFLLKISRPFEQLKKIRTIYSSNQNIIYEQDYKNLQTNFIFNDGTPSFNEKLKKYA